MRIPTAVRWTCLALLGILIAAAVSVAASRLASQQIGLASEPISAGDALAPARRAAQAPPERATTKPQPASPASEPPAGEPTTAEPPPSEAPPSESPAEVGEPRQSGGDGERGGGGADD